MRLIRWTVLFVLCLTLACSGDNADSGKTTAGDIKKEISDVFETTKRFTSEQKQAYQERVEEQLVQYRARIAELKSQLESANDETRAELERRIAELQDGIKTVNMKAEQIETAGDSAFKDIKVGIDAALEQLDKGFEKARSNFKSDEDMAGSDI